MECVDGLKHFCKLQAYNRHERLEGKNMFQKMLMVFCIWMAMDIPILTGQAADIASRLAKIQLTDSLGNLQSLQSYAGKIVVYVFWSFKCPISLVYASRLDQLLSKCQNRDVVILGIESGANETPSAIKANLENLKIRIPMLLDSDGILAQALGATHTPSVFIFDRDWVLRYRGALDNSRKVGDKGRIAYADDALDAILAGRSVLIPETKAFGCSIRLPGNRE